MSRRNRHRQRGVVDVPRGGAAAHGFFGRIRGEPASLQLALKRRGRLTRTTEDA
jgi:hypothetical protein